MRLDKLCVAYYSPTRTSRSVARAIADGIGIARREEHDLTTDRSDNPLHVADSLCVVAAPVYGGLLAPEAARRIGRLETTNSVAVAVVVYGNRDYEDALVQLRELLRGRGFTVMCGAAFVGEHSYSRPGMPIAEGRPDTHDLQLATGFGRQAYANLLRQLDIDHPPAPDARDFALAYGKPLESLIATPEMRGNVPWKTLGQPTPQAPVVGEACYGCGDCVAVCPTGAISLRDGRSTTDISLCTKCCACVKFCPANARTFDTPYTAMLHERCATRREPEVFL